MTTTVDQVFRDWSTQAVPSSGDHKPRKAEVRALLKMIQNSSGLAVTRNTLTALQGVTPPTENYMGIVLDDADATKNGYYSRVSSAWVWERGFPDTFAPLTLAGTANAQTATVDAGVNPADALVYFATVSTENTGPMTLSISGETARDVVNAAGNALSGGEWTGTVLFFLNGDGDYQLLFEAGAVAAAAQSATNAAASAAAAAAFGVVDFDDVPDLLADNNDVIGYAGSGASVEVASGFRLSAGGFPYDVADSTATDEHVETAGGVLLYLRKNADLTVYSDQAGINASTTSAAAINKMLTDALAAGARTVKMAKGDWTPDGIINWPIGLAEIDWQGSLFTAPDVASGSYAFDYYDTPELVGYLSAYADGSRDYLTFAGADTFEIGDVIGLRNTTTSSLNAWRTTYYDGQITKVREIVSSTQLRVWDLIDPRGAVGVFPATDTEVFRLRKRSQNLALRNLTMRGSNTDVFAMARLSGISDFELENLDIQGGSYAALALNFAAYGRSEGLRLGNMGAATGQQYGLVQSSVQYHKTFGTTAFGTRHALHHGNTDGVGAVPPRYNEHYGVNLGSDSYTALDFGHGNVMDSRVVGGTVQGLALGGENNHVDIDVLTTAPLLDDGNRAIAGANMHGMNHKVRIGKIVTGGNGLDAGSPSSHGIIGFGGSGDVFTANTVHGGVLDIEVGTIDARRWSQTGAPLARFRNRGFLGQWGVRMHVDQIICPVEPSWFLCDVVSGSSPSLIDIAPAPDRWDPSVSTPTHGWNAATRGFSYPAIADKGQVEAPLLVGAVAHAGGALAIDTPLYLTITGFSGLSPKDSIEWGVDVSIPGETYVECRWVSAAAVRLKVVTKSSGVTIPASTWYAYVTKRP